MIKCPKCNGNMIQVQASDLTVRDKNYRCDACKYSMYPKNYLVKKWNVSRCTVGEVDSENLCPVCQESTKKVECEHGEMHYCSNCDSFIMPEQTLNKLEIRQTISFAADETDYDTELDDEYEYKKAMQEVQYNTSKKPEYKKVEVDIDYNCDENMTQEDFVLAFFGLPIKDKNVKVTGSAYVTLFLMVACVEFFILSMLGNYPEIIKNFGFTPGRPFHFYGFTLISTMFMHGGIWHLISNLYFLYIYGDSVEAKLGKVKFIILILLSNLLGDLLHSVVNLHSDIPLIGISGAVSGVAVFYTILYPNNTFSFLPFFVFQILFMRGNYWWLRIKAKYILGIWLFFQILDGISSGESNVAFFCHIGGAICGFIMALVFNPKIDEEKKTNVYRNMTR